METPENTFLRKYQLIIAIVAGLLVPAVTGVAGYYRARSDFESKLTDMQLHDLNTFAKSQDVKDLTVKIDVIASDVSEIKGYLRKAKR